MCAGKSLRTFPTDLSLRLPDLRSHFFHRFQMQVDGTRSDRTATRITDPDPFTPPQHTAEQED